MNPAKPDFPLSPAGGGSAEHKRFFKRGVFGLFIYGKENNIIFGSGNNGAARVDPYQCFLTALGTVIGFPDILDIYDDFVNGVTPKTVLKALKALGKGIFTGIRIGLAILSLGDCLDWW